MSKDVVSAFADDIRAEVREHIDLVLGRSLTLKELSEQWGVHQDIARRYLREIACLASVVKEGTKYTVTLTPERVEREAFLRKLQEEMAQRRAEVTRRREEARDKYKSWRANNVNTLHQSALLDWIEDDVLVWFVNELGKLPEATTP